jgi:hypothetical protein
MAGAGLASITIDVDSLRFYREIHGLTAAGEDIAVDPIYTIALARFFELLAAAGAPATLFLIGADAPAHGDLLRSGIAASGSEVASHSFSHDYRLSTASEDRIKEDLEQGHAALLSLSGAPIVGFRAPGYNVTPSLLRAVRELGYRYDSSLLPSPWYFAARGSAIAAYRLQGRRSHSLLGNARQFLGPMSPYRFEPDAPWKDAGATASLLELPMACDPITRLWLIGTTWVLLPAAARKLALDSALRRLPHFNFEMHAIDLLDTTDAPVLRELAPLQPDLRVPASKKVAAFSELFSRLKGERTLTTLRDAATHF